MIGAGEMSLSPVLDTCRLSLLHTLISVIKPSHISVASVSNHTLALLPSQYSLSKIISLPFSPDIGFAFNPTESQQSNQDQRPPSPRTSSDTNMHTSYVDAESSYTRRGKGPAIKDQAIDANQALQFLVMICTRFLLDFREHYTFVADSWALYWT